MDRHGGRWSRPPVVRGAVLPLLVTLVVVGGFGLTGCTARDTAPPPGPTPVSSSGASSQPSAPSTSSFRPSSDAEGDPDAPGGTLGTTAWFRTALPVEGRVVGMVQATSADGSPSPVSGTVRISRAGTAAVHLDFSDLRVPSELDADLRVQLSASDVVIGDDGVGSVVRNGTASGIAGGDPIEVGVLARDASTSTLTFTTPQILPPSVHSLLILDYRHATVLAGAELVPADG